MVVANASNARVVSDALAERLAGFRAVLDDRSLATGLVAVQGPRSLEILAPLTDIDLAGIRYYGIAEGAVAGIPALVARTGYTGEDGFEVFVDVERTGELWDAMLGAGRPHGLVPVGLGARDTLRLEAGMPLYGNELDRATNPFEAGLGRVVKLAKPRRLHRAGRRSRTWRADGVDRRLVGLVLRERGIARHGYPVLDDDGADGRRHLGHDVAHPRGRDRDGVRRPAARANPVRCSPSRSAVPVSPPRSCRSRSTGGRPDVRRAPPPAPQPKHRQSRSPRGRRREDATEEPARWSPATCATPRSTSGSASRVTRP